MLRPLFDVVRDLFHFIFPEQCVGCDRIQKSADQILCKACRIELPTTKYASLNDNPIERIFWGKVELESASALLYFKKGGIAQRLMHALKYQGNYQVGVLLGELFAQTIQEGQICFDAIVPLPLHENKRKQRGYNQCDAIAEGIAMGLTIPLLQGVVERIHQNESQTKKGRYDRWLNVQDLFRVTDSASLEGKHLLLVDDVITTGATAEACVQSLLKVEGVKVSFACIGCPPIV